MGAQARNVRLWRLQADHRSATPLAPKFSSAIREMQNSCRMLEQRTWQPQIYILLHSCKTHESKQSKQPLPTTVYSSASQPLRRTRRQQGAQLPQPRPDSIDTSLSRQKRPTLRPQRQAVPKDLLWYEPQRLRGMLGFSQPFNSRCRQAGPGGGHNERPPDTTLTGRQRP